MMRHSFLFSHQQHGCELASRQEYYDTLAQRHRDRLVESIELVLKEGGNGWDFGEGFDFDNAKAKCYVLFCHRNLSGTAVAAVCVFVPHCHRVLQPHYHALVVALRPGWTDGEFFWSGPENFPKLESYAAGQPWIAALTSYRASVEVGFPHCHRMQQRSPRFPTLPS